MRKIFACIWSTILVIAMISAPIFAALGAVVGGIVYYIKRRRCS